MLFDIQIIIETDELHFDIYELLSPCVCLHKTEANMETYTQTEGKNCFFEIQIIIETAKFAFLHL